MLKFNTFSLMLSLSISANLNTSYVKVQSYDRMPEETREANLNTSYVKVQFNTDCIF